MGPALDNTNLVWTASGAKAWFGQGSVSHDGVDAAQSGAIGHGQQSVLQATVTGATSLGFWWKVSSELNDALSFRIDGVEQFKTGGLQGWRWEGYYLPSGVHTVRWEYAKDAVTSAGADAAWVDGVATGLFGAAMPLGSGWMWSPWFGYFSNSAAPWLYHNEHAWLYPFGQDPASVVFWDAGMNAFWWTGDTMYTYLYRFSDSSWLWYLPNSSNPRVFLNLKTGQWEQR